MENKNILCVRVSNRGNEIFGTSFNPNEITYDELFRKIYWGDLDADGEEFAYEELDDEESEDEEFVFDEEYDYEYVEGKTSEEQFNDQKKLISDYSIDSETFFEDITVEIDLNGKSIFEYGSFPSDVKVVQSDKKESYKNVINPSENNDCVLWLYYDYHILTYYWNDIVDFDINKLKIYCSTRINEIESKEYKLFTGLTYDDKDPNNKEFESIPGSVSSGPDTF